MTDNINPPHYRYLDVECIDVAEHFSYCAGNALKYIWRHQHKGEPLNDLRKSVWYLNREIKRLEKPFAPSQKTEEPSVVLCKESDYEDAREIIRAGRDRHSGNVIGGSREPTPAEKKEMLREGKL